VFGCNGNNVVGNGNKVVPGTVDESQRKEKAGKKEDGAVESVEFHWGRLNRLFSEFIYSIPSLLIGL
jgi:hypothetical protein